MGGTAHPLTLIEKLARTPDPQDAGQTLFEHLDPPDRLGWIYIFGGRLDPKCDSSRPGHYTVFGNDWSKRWWERYSADPAFRIDDPVRSLVRRGVTLIDWREVVDHRSFVSGRRLWCPLWNLGISQGFTVPIHEPGLRRYGCFSVVHFGNRSRLEIWKRERAADLVGAAHLFHAVRQSAVSGAVRYGRLSPRERECLSWISNGMSSKETARRLGISPRTVDLHVARAMKRLGARTRAEAVVRAIRLDLIDP